MELGLCASRGFIICVRWRQKGRSFMSPSMNAEGAHWVRCRMRDARLASWSCAFFLPCLCADHKLLWMVCVISVCYISYYLPSLCDARNRGPTGYRQFHAPENEMCWNKVRPKLEPRGLCVGSLLMPIDSTLYHGHLAAGWLDSRAMRVRSL